MSEREGRCHEGRITGVVRACGFCTVTVLGMLLAVGALLAGLLFYLRLIKTSWREVLEICPNGF
jgi:hypothetical protein